MGIDLRLLPATHVALGERMGFSHNVLDLPRSYAVFDEIRRLPSEPVPDQTTSFVARLPNGERGYGDLTTDAYGMPYRMVRAADLFGVLSRLTTGWPATAYIGAMPPDAWVILDWH